MPTYEYQCDACGLKFEKFQSITSSAVKKCPKCGKNKVRRLISSGAGVIFKGGGFYQTDYRSESYKAGEKSDTPSTPTDSKPAETKGKDKGAASTETKAAESKPTETKPVEPKASKSAAKGSKKKSGE
jgi:putative FmdB family regulatory protein